MNKILLLILAFIAMIVLVVNVGPLAILCLSIWLLYIIFKQFLKSHSTLARIGWVVLGLFVMSIDISNIYAVIGLGAAYILYIIYKYWKENMPQSNSTADGSASYFENEWADLNKF